jgi:hypothetical protein
MDSEIVVVATQQVEVCRLVKALQLVVQVSYVLS